jgi:hypothetical protein
MNLKILYIIAAVLAFAAAAIYYLRAEPGESLAVRVGLLIVLGAVMLWYGLKRPNTPAA